MNQKKHVKCSCRLFCVLLNFDIIVLHFRICIRSNCTEVNIFRIEYEDTNCKIRKTFNNEDEEYSSFSTVVFISQHPIDGVI